MDFFKVIKERGPGLVPNLKVRELSNFQVAPIFFKPQGKSRAHSPCRKDFGQGHFIFKRAKSEQSSKLWEGLEPGLKSVDKATRAP